ncbi:MAG: ABC transporter substrate-binding protein [Burkholderiales bacterium]
MTTPQVSAPWLAAFREGMADLRWVEGRDYVIDARHTNGVEQAGPAMAAELVTTQPDLLLVQGDESARQLAQRTKTIPIVFAGSQDPLANGLVASLRRPGGNATGLTNLAVELAAKRLQLLKEAVPNISHVVLLFDAAYVGSSSQVKGIEDAAARLRLRVTSIGLRQAADIDPAFKRGAALGAQAYMVAAAPFFGLHRQAISDRIVISKIPLISENPFLINAGGLMSYGPSGTDNMRRAAAYVDKVLKGAKPGELPIEQPTRFELVINQKTAKALGIKFPQSILIQADRVIE